MDLTELTATQLCAGLARGRFTSVDITRACLERIEQLDGRVNAFLDVAADRALEQSEHSDRRRAANQPLSQLDGVPIAVKDVVCTANWRTTCASRMLENFVPPYDATVIAKLRTAGLVLIGKTNMDEFAMGSSTENSALATTHNPWDAERVPGGSSGGSAAAVAARMVPLAVGTDTGGSIRQPAAYCGIVGLKPTYGRVSRYGLIAFASSLDQIGPMARTAEDAALLLEVLAGHDPRDSTSADHQAPQYSALLKQPLAGLRIGVVGEHFGEGLDPEVRDTVQQAIAQLRTLGASVHAVSLPHSKFAIATYYIVAPCEASSNLARYDGVHYGYRTDERALRNEFEALRKNTDDPEQLESLLVRMYRRTRAEGFGAEVKRRIMLGTYALSAGYYDAYYLRALKVRRLIRDNNSNAFQNVDLLIGPTTPSPAFLLGEKVNDPLAMYLQDLYTVSANLAGIAGISIPCGFTASGLPIGMQLQAAPFAEELLLRAAHQFQEHTDWHTKAPALP